MTSVPRIDTPRGHTEVSTKAMTRLVSAVAAEALGVTPGQVTVDHADADGALDVTVRVPIRALPGEPGRPGADTTDAGDAVQARADRTQQHIRGTVTALTGTPINEVTVRLTTPRLRLPLLGG